MRNLLIAMTAAGFLAGSVSYAAAGVADLPRTTGVEQSMKTSDLENRGDLARAHKSFYQAAEFYRSALRLDPRNASIYNKLGISELREGDLRAAKSDFQRAAKLNPKDPRALNNLGALSCLQKKYKPATKYLKEALALDETDAAFHVNLGEAWVGLGKIDRAMTEYARALELDGDIFSSNATEGITAQVRTPEQRARVSYLIAKAYAKRGNMDGALEYLRRAKEDRYPELAKVYEDTEFAGLWQDPRLNKLVPR
jgi:Flp pilus assembly protein TadD